VRLSQGNGDRAVERRLIAKPADLDPGRQRHQLGDRRADGPKQRRVAPDAAAEHDQLRVDHSDHTRDRHSEAPSHVLHECGIGMGARRYSAPSNPFPTRDGYIQIIVVVTTLVAMAVFSYLVARTRLGRNMRACEQDLKMAALSGIDVDRTISLTFVIGAALAAVAGLMFLLYYGVIDFYIGFIAGIKAFTAAVLGGIGSLPGAVLGGLLIGLIEVFWSAYFSVEYKDVAAFSILIVALIFLPTGIMGQAEVEKV